MPFTQLWNKEFQKNTIFLDRNSLMNVIECGVFEGLTSNYIVDNLLASNGNLVCVDNLADDYSLDSDNELFRGQYERFIENIENKKDRITLVREKSEDALPKLRSSYYDFIYVDAHHSEAAVYFDGTEAFRLCKDFAYILFDDFLWGGDGGMKRGIEKVLSENPNHRLLLKLNQVLVQKLPEGSPTEDGQDEYQNKTIEKLFNKDTIYAAYCNLDSREDRNRKMIEELNRVNLEIPIVRRRSFPWDELYNKFTDEEKAKVQVMLVRSPGAIGCQYSQIEVMKEALRQGKHAWVNEDDLVFCNDMPARLKIIYKFLNQHEWDIFWFGGTYHKEPNWHGSIEGVHTNPDMHMMCDCKLNRDWEPTLNPNIVRTYGAFSTHSYLVNKDRIQHILDLIDRNTKYSMGIDWIMIKEEPNLNTFAFNPGCIIQHDNQSNIGNGISYFSGFARLGKHWFAPSMDNYIPD